ncbi:hypothetical protein M885DRAFT_172734 [Pelagophyceae sp. CCMP2097]|nr:hypothetical protein M885DRAFT_172734 [Pelagophyceae sp. CCMP2097]
MGQSLEDRPEKAPLGNAGPCKAPRPRKDPEEATGPCKAPRTVPCTVFSRPSHFSSAVLWPPQRLLVWSEGGPSHSPLQGPPQRPVQGPSKRALARVRARGLWTVRSKTPFCSSLALARLLVRARARPGWVRPESPL